MTYLYGHRIPRNVQKALGTKQTRKFDEGTRLAVAARWGGTGKKLSPKQVDDLLNGVG